MARRQRDGAEDEEGEPGADAEKAAIQGGKVFPDKALEVLPTGTECIGLDGREYTVIPESQNAGIWTKSKTSHRNTLVVIAAVLLSFLKEMRVAHNLNRALRRVVSLA